MVTPIGGLNDDLLSNVFSFLGNGAFISKAQKDRDLKRSYILESFAEDSNVMDFMFPDMSTKCLKALMKHVLKDGSLSLMKAVYNLLKLKRSLPETFHVLTSIFEAVDFDRVEFIEWLVVVENEKLDTPHCLKQFWLHAARKSKPRAVIWLMVKYSTNRKEVLHQTIRDVLYVAVNYNQPCIEQAVHEFLRVHYTTVHDREAALTMP